MKWLGIAVCVGAALLGAGSASAADRSEAEARALIDKGAVTPNPRDMMHTMLAQQAALAAAKDRRCDRVWHAGKSSRGTPDNPAAYADCENRFRVYLYANGRLDYVSPR